MTKRDNEGRWGRTSRLPTGVPSPFHQERLVSPPRKHQPKHPSDPGPLGWSRSRLLLLAFRVGGLGEPGGVTEAPGDLLCARAATVHGCFFRVFERGCRNRILISPSAVGEERGRGLPLGARFLALLAVCLTLTKQTGLAPRPQPLWGDTDSSAASCWGRGARRAPPGSCIPLEQGRGVPASPAPPRAPARAGKELVKWEAGRAGRRGEPPGVLGSQCVAPRHPVARGQTPVSLACSMRKV